MKRLLFICCCIFYTCFVYGQDKDEQAIRGVLAAQSEQWNKGNIAGYMKGYWESDSLQFIGKNGPDYGYATTLAHYQKAYPDAAHMGVLHFDIISIKRLCADYGFVTGKWSLQRSAGDVSGYFTLLFRKMESGAWVIVADHSS
jgi:ketosteroid isomerase-like protein